MAVKIEVSGSELGVSDPEYIQLLKVLTPESGEFLEYITTATGTEEDDGKFTLLKDGALAETISVSENDKYDLVVFIEDG